MAMQSEDTMPPNKLKKGTLPRLSVAFIGFLLPVLGFAKLAFEVRKQSRPRFDLFFLNWLHSFGSPLLDRFFIAVTTIGDALVVASVTVLSSLYLFYIKRRRQATLLLFGVGGAAVLNVIIKFSFQRPRPDLWQHLVEETGYSFPSGHAMASSALAFTVIVMLWSTKWRWWAIVVGATYAVLVGVSRLYLGVHYPSDIAAGWCISLAWVLIVKWIIDTFGTSAKVFIKTHLKIKKV